MSSLCCASVSSRLSLLSCVSIGACAGEGGELALDSDDEASASTSSGEEMANSSSSGSEDQDENDSSSSESDGASTSEPSTSSDTSTSTDTSTSSETDTGEPPPGWQLVHQAGEDEGALMSVWGPAPDDVFAVGGQIQPNTGTVLHFDGSTWTPESLPPDTPMLDWVFGSGERVWAVGRLGTILVRDAGVWASEPSPTTTILWGVWGASEDELWAVGGNGTSDVPVLLRRDGATQSWAQVELPPLGVNSNGLFKVWGSGPADVWAVGDRGAALHFDGASWTAHPSAAAIDLISVWGSPSEGFVAAGGRASGHVARLDGEAWLGQMLDAPGLNGIWIDPAGPITLVGNQGTIFSLAPGGYEIVEEPSPTPMVLHAVFGFSGGPRFAVGGSLLAPPPYIGVILESP